MEQVIQIQNVSKSYGRKQILKNVSFEAKQGRITAFLGPNGIYLHVKLIQKILHFILMEMKLANLITHPHLIHISLKVVIRLVH